MYDIVGDPMLCNYSEQVDDDDRLSRVAAVAAVVVVVVTVVGQGGLAEQHIAAGECQGDHCSRNGRGREHGSICLASFITGGRGEGLGEDERRGG